MRMCPECGQDNIEIMVDVTVIIPSRMENLLSKSNIKSKDVKIYSANWPKCRYICKTVGCGWIKINT